ncbi:MAG: WYL domain-containing protein [Candidatus Methylacidiphilales bacterium]|nr:WYL domain-containing protein [Candidatus Methylacidiphilales bacterium]
MKKPKKPLRRVSLNMLERFDRLKQEIQAGRLRSMEAVANELGVTRKTIWNDLQEMMRRGHDIAFDRAEGLWKYLKPPPGLNLTENEIFALMVAEKVVSASQGTGFEAPLRQTIRRFAVEKSAQYGFSWEDLRNGISIAREGLVNFDHDLYMTVVQALSRNQELEFHYRGIKDQAFRRRRVRPYHLRCGQGQWVLLGYEFAGGMIKTFALCRMRTARMLSTQFTSPDLSAIQAELEGSMGVYVGGEVVDVEVEFDPIAARWVQERIWHASQTIDDLPDGRLRLRLRVVQSPELERWILGWGEHAKVIHPPSLCDSIGRRLVVAAQTYESKGSSDSECLRPPVNTQVR